MDDNDKTSAWDELAKDLGAEPTPESFHRQSHDTESMPPATESSEPQDAVQANPSDWAGLGNTLGIPVEAEPTPIAEPPDQELSAGPTDPTKTESNVKESLAHDKSKIIFEEEMPLEADPNAEDSGEEAASTEKGSSIISGDDAQDAFDALFLSGAAAAEVCGKISSPIETDTNEEAVDGEDSGKEKKSRRPRRRRGRGRGRQNQSDQLEAAEDAVEEAAAAKDEAHSELDPFGGFLASLETEQADTTEDKAEEQSSDDAEKSDDRKKGPRRRRSRRRGRGRGTSAGDSENSTTTPEDAMETSVDPDDGDVSPDDDEDFSDADSQKGKRPSHRNIPTWQEAMSMIVDTNMESRKRAPAKAGSASSSRGRGRGRGRGGRPRKKP